MLFDVMLLKWLLYLFFELMQFQPRGVLKSSVANRTQREEFFSDLFQES